jgi:hypothetical protein
MTGNGAVDSSVGYGFGGEYANASSYSFGKPNDFAAVYTVSGQDYIENERGVSISQEYKDWIAFQRNSVDPLYFISGEGASESGVTVARNWYMRTGARDIVTPIPIFFNLATTLENQGKNVSAALVWDQGHGLTSDLDGFFEFADKAISGEAPITPTTTPVPPSGGGGGGIVSGGGGGSSPVPSPSPSPVPAPTVPDAVPNAAEVWANPFDDVNSGDWFYGDVAYAHAKGLFGGVGAATFGPNLSMSRGMLVTVLGRLAKADVSGYANANSFSDVPADRYYAPYVAWAQANAIVSGVSGDAFAPDAPITRQDLAAVLTNYARFTGRPLPVKRAYEEFADAADIAVYAKASVESVAKAAIIGGKPGNLFDPGGDATRAEVAAMLRRYIEAVE